MHSVLGASGKITTTAKISFTVSECLLCQKK